MILRRVIDHVKTQNWTAVGIDFVIVVVGVFIGIQVSNWNDARADERAYQDAMKRLAEESAETLVSARETRAAINDALADVQPAIDLLRTCEFGPDAEGIVNQGLNTIRSARGAEAVTLTIDRLVVDPRLLERQRDEERVALRRYHESLHASNFTAEFVLRTADAGNDSHPLIGFTELVDPDETINGVDVRRARVDGPLADACKDKSFLKLFYRWERAHVFQLHLIDQLEDIVREYMRVLNLGTAATLEGDS